jgi:hypothetical protein
MENFKRKVICLFLFLICLLILYFLNKSIIKEGYSIYSNFGKKLLLATFGYNNGNGFAGYTPGERGYVSRYGIYGYGPKWTN